MPAVRRAPVPVQLRNSCKGRFLSRSARLRIGFLRGFADYGKAMALSDRSYGRRRNLVRRVYPQGLFRLPDGAAVATKEETVFTTV